jgi:tetratricopeptide (TPR) repeat protein
MTEVLQRLQTALQGRYEVEREIGHGGMSIVYLARDVKHDREVALKVLRSDLAASLGADRFLREIQITAKLQHPHILPLHDSGVADDILFYVMPFVEGESLEDRLKREKQLPVEDALRIVDEVAGALAYAHKKEVIHRDIKPGNILLTGGHAVVADFGIAQAVHLAGEKTVRMDDSVSGTPAYMSPEQATGGEVDARTDIYSLASVLYEMLVGHAPFTDATPQGLMKQILSEPAPSVRTHRETVSEPVEAAVMKALAKLPADRFSTVSKFADALTGAQSDTGRTVTVQAVPSAAPATPEQPASHPRQMKLAPALAIFFVSAAAVLGITFILVQQFGLPDWVFPGAVVLALLGLPILVTTSIVQAKHHTDTAVARAAAGKPRTRHWLTWRKAITGGVAAFAVWGLVAAGYMTSRKMGVGPGASLVSAGVLDEQSEVLIAEFENKTDDELLGEALKEALSVDLAQSTALKVVSPDRVVEVLSRMEKDPDTALDLEMAREVAVRDGIKAVVAGQITPTGSSYVLTARLIAAESGDVLTAHRETAKDDSELIEAVDKLSYKLRERIGESLTTIRGEKPLAEVTTGSLEALQKYSVAVQAEEYDQNPMRAVELLREAIAADTTFAMAYRKLAVVLGNTGMDDAGQLQAVTKAYEHRDKLTERERYLAVAYYHSTWDEHEKAISAYESLLDLDPNDIYALNNLGVEHGDLGNNEKALGYARRVLELEKSPNHFGNVIANLIPLGRFEESESVYQEYVEFAPGPPTSMFGAWAASGQRDFELSHARLDEVSNAAKGNQFLTRGVSFMRSAVYAVNGRLADAEREMRVNKEANLALGAAGNALNIVLHPAQLDVLVRERNDRVERIIEAALEEFPLDSLDPVDRPYLDLATLYAMTGDGDRSRAYIDDYERTIDPRTRRAQQDVYHTALGILAMTEGNARRAIDEFQLAREKGNWPFMPFLGSAYDMAGEPDSALVEYEKYITTHVIWGAVIDQLFLASSYYRVAELYEDKGDADTAVHYYNKFTELWKDADEELQPRVKAAQARITALTAEKPKS